MADFLLFPRNCRRNDIIARCRDQSPSTSPFHRHDGILLCTLSNLSRTRCIPLLETDVSGGNGSLLLHVRLNDVYLNSLYFLYRFSSATRVRPRVNYRFIFNTLDSETMIRTNIFLKRKLENDCQIDFYFIRNKGEKKMKKEIQTFLRIFPNIFNNRSSCTSSYVVQAYLEGALSKELYRKYIGNSCHEQFRSLR